MKRIHYAWVICLCGMWLFVCNMGLCSNILSVYLPFIEATGISHSMGSAILTVRCLFSFAVTFLVELYYRRLSLRRGILIASLIGVLSAAVYSLGGSAFVYFAGAALGGVCYGLGTVFPVSLLLTRWFHARRGLALGISTAGSGVASMVCSPLVSALVLRYSLPTAFLVQGAFMLASALAIFLLLRDDPAQKGLAPYGEGGESGARVREQEGPAALPGHVVWMLALMMLFIGGAGQAFSGHLSVLARSCGYGVRTAARVRAAYRVRVVNPVQFLQKMVGSNVNAQGLGDLSDYFAGEFQGRIKSAVSRYLNSLEQELIGLDAYMDEISGQIMPYIDEALSEYGLKCVRFTLAGLDIDTSKYDRLDESQMRMITNQRGVMSQRAELDTLGPDWGRVQGAGLLRDIVNHPGAAMGAGMGVGLGAAGAVGTIARQVFTPAADGYPPQHAAGASTFAGSPNHPAAGANGFAGSPPRPGVTASGSAGAPASSDRVARLRELKMMLDEGLIEPAEYDAAKADILREMRG